MHVRTFASNSTHIYHDAINYAHIYHDAIYINAHIYHDAIYTNAHIVKISISILKDTWRLQIRLNNATEKWQNSNP